MPLTGRVCFGTGTSATVLSYFCCAKQLTTFGTWNSSPIPSCKTGSCNTSRCLVSQSFSFAHSARKGHGTASSHHSEQADRRDNFVYIYIPTLMDSGHTGQQFSLSIASAALLLQSHCRNAGKPSIVIDNRKLKRTAFCSKSSKYMLKMTANAQSTP